MGIILFLIKNLLILLLLGSLFGCVHTLKFSEPKTTFDNRSIAFDTICIQAPKYSKTGISWDQKKSDIFWLKIKTAFPNQTFSCEKNDSNKKHLNVQILIDDHKTFLDGTGYENVYINTFIITLGIVPYITEFKVSTNAVVNTLNNQSFKFSTETEYYTIAELFLTPFFLFLKSDEEQVIDDTLKIIRKILVSRSEQIRAP